MKESSSLTRLVRFSNPFCAEFDTAFLQSPAVTAARAALQLKARVFAAAPDDQFIIRQRSMPQRTIAVSSASTTTPIASSAVASTLGFDLNHSLHTSIRHHARMDSEFQPLLAIAAAGSPASTGPPLKSLSRLQPAALGPDTSLSKAEPALRQRLLTVPSLSPSRRDEASGPAYAESSAVPVRIHAAFLLPACPRRSIRWPFPCATVQPQPPLATRQTAFTNKVFPKCESSVSHVAMGTGARCGPWA